MCNCNCQGGLPRDGERRAESASDGFGSALQPCPSAPVLEFMNLKTEKRIKCRQSVSKHFTRRIISFGTIYEYKSVGFRDFSHSILTGFGDGRLIWSAEGATIFAADPPTTTSTLPKPYLFFSPTSHHICSATEWDSIFTLLLCEIE